MASAPPLPAAAHAPAAYLRLSTALSVLLTASARAVGADASLGLLLFTPLFALVHHVAVLYAAHREGRCISPARQPQRARRPLALAADHAGVLRVFAVLHAVAALIVALAVRRTVADLRCAPCARPHARGHCDALRWKLAAQVLQGLLAAAEAVVLSLLLRAASAQKWEAAGGGAEMREAEAGERQMEADYREHRLEVFGLAFPPRSEVCVISVRAWIP